MLEKTFATPALLWTLSALPAALALMLFARFRKKQLAARLASPLLLRKHKLVRPRLRRWKAVCILFALGLTAVACAGPQWGLDPAGQIRKGRDVMVVLDLSRSMNAEQPSRRELAIRALRQLADAFEDHGGNRIALVGFAARARLFFPFTHDCDHLRHMLTQIEADDYPPLGVKDPVSGTRIGAGLKLAVESCDPERTNGPVIVLLSDGDDPVDDDEWLDGVNAAAERKIPVHVVGIGNPDQAETIPLGRDFLRFEGEPVRTKLNEDRLRKIAKLTGGEYLPAHRGNFALGTYVLQLLDADDLREDVPSIAAVLPVYQLRYVWLLLPAAVLLMLTMLMNEGPRIPAFQPFARAAPRARAPALLLLLTAIVLVSAADPPEVEALLRQGDEAFARQDYDAALGFYEKIGGRTQDPGRVSFNQAATYYRLERYKDAIDCYRRSLEDDRMPAERRARACFDLGNATLQQADGDPRQLADAVAAYRAALQLADENSSLRKDARHNLELAQMLWLKARAHETKEKVSPPRKSETPTDKEKSSKKSISVFVPVDPTDAFKPQKLDNLPGGRKSANAQTGSIHVIPDSEKVVPLSPPDTWATLADHARRIAEARRQQRQPKGPGQLSTKDW